MSLIRTIKRTYILVCLETGPLNQALLSTNPRNKLMVNIARFERIQDDRDPDHFFSSGTGSLRKNYSITAQGQLTLLDIYKDIANHNIISPHVLMCTRDNQSYIFYDQLDHFLVVLDKKPTTYQIKSFNVNPSTELCQLEGGFELAITPILEDHIQASLTFKSIDLMTGPEIPFARQAFILDHFIKKEVNITHQDIVHESYQVMLQALHCRLSNIRRSSRI